MPFGTFTFFVSVWAIRLNDVVFCFRSGNMYGVRLLEDLKIDPQQGVVRVSLVHYNTEEEVEALITALNDVLLG